MAVMVHDSGGAPSAFSLGELLRLIHNARQHSALHTRQEAFPASHPPQEGFSPLFPGQREGIHSFGPPALPPAQGANLGPNYQAELAALRARFGHGAPALHPIGELPGPPGIGPVEPPPGGFGLGGPSVHPIGGVPGAPGIGPVEPPATSRPPVHLPPGPLLHPYGYLPGNPSAGPVIAARQALAGYA